MKLIDQATFEQLSPAEKRIAICRDVIARIDGGLICPQNGSFFANFELIRNEEQSPQETLNTRECQVCAKGALMCSWVGNFNKADWHTLEGFDESLNYINYPSYPEQLLEIFGREMLDNIEAAFEGAEYCWHYDELLTKPYADAFLGYNLRGIMEYIIKNGGFFPLPQDS